MDNRPVQVRPLPPSAPPPPAGHGAAGEPRVVGSVRAQVDRELPIPALGAETPAELAAAIRALTEATRILADGLDDLWVQLRAR